MNYTFPELLTNRTILTIKTLISFVLVTYMFFLGGEIVRGNQMSITLGGQRVEGGGG